MIRDHRLRIALVVVSAGLLAAACTGQPDGTGGSTAASSPAASTAGPASGGPGPRTGSASPARRSGEFTMAFAGDVHFSGRVRERLDRDPATVFAEAAPGLARADLSMVNLETAVTDAGEQQNKLFTFRAPPAAFAAMRDAGIDVATMANNHGADYGLSGLRDSLAAAGAAGFPVVGIGRNASAAYAPYTTRLNGVPVAIIGADQVQDETTLSLFTAGRHSPGVASAFSDRLVKAVSDAKAQGYVVVVYVHWGVEYQTCPSQLQRDLAGELADAGASAVIGTHAHVLQGAGWRPDGTYVAYGLGNYLWWMSFGNEQDDNGVLTLSFRRDRVVGAKFAPSHLDDRGVPVPSTGAERRRIGGEWKADRGCAGLAARPPH